MTAPYNAGQRPEDTGGAGRGGGLLFVVVLLFVAYLALQALIGLVRFLVFGALLVLALVVLARVSKRR